MNGAASTSRELERHHITHLQDDEEEGDCCRICRCGATEDNTLFYPCKCSGSIKYVHQQCLIDWLAHSGNTHCEVCKHKFSFTPVYAKDAPSRLPWHELAVGLLKRAAAAVRVAHRVWLVSCVWLILVPWITCLAWRLAFLQSFDEVPRMLLERCNVLAVATDCIQGSLLSIGIVFLNIAVSTLKEQLKGALNNLEQQLVRDAVPAALAPAVAVENAAAAEAAAWAAEAAAWAAAEHAAAGGAGDDDGDGGNLQQAIAEQPQPHPAAADGVAAADGNAAAAAAAAAVLDDAVAAADAILGDGRPAGDDDVGDIAVGDGEEWGDVPFEELLGLQGPWLNFLETVVLVIVGNTFFMAGVVYLPLNIGRLLLNAARRACSMMTAEQQQLVMQLVGQHVRVPFLAELVQFVLGILAPMAVPEDVLDGLTGNSTAVAAAANAALGVNDSFDAGTAAAAAANLTSVAAAAAANASAVLPAVVDPVDLPSLGVMPISFDHVIREIQAQLELPAQADFVALSLGHCCLGAVLLLALWLYMSVRLWRAASRRLRRTGRRPLLQVIGSTGRWLFSAASLVSKGTKLLLLLSIELGAFPLAAGLWLDICALPLTSSSLGQRGELLAKTPLIAGFMHWVLGVGFLLGFTFLACVVREVLRPGALPFLKDPTNPDRNPIREMLDEPLVKHLGRVAMSWLVYAGLCVVLVHLPALLAKALVPSLYPLRVALFDPLIQIPADMLLLQLLIPYAIEHVRVKGAVKAAVHAWLQLAGRMLGWSDYLLPPPPNGQQRPPPPPAAAPAAPAEAAAPTAAGAGPVGTAAAPIAVESDSGEEKLQTMQQQQQQREGSSLQQHTATAAADHAHASSSRATEETGAVAPQSSVAAAEQQPMMPPPTQQEQQQRPVEWYHQQPSYSSKVVCLALSWLATMVIYHLLLFTLPVGLGRGLFSLFGLPFKNDLFTGGIGLLALWGGYSLAASVATSANMSGVKAVLVAAWKWLVLAGQCGLLLVLWLGVVATMMGMLCELVLLPLRLPPNQTALIYLYQDWTMGVLALKLLHLLVMVRPRRDGRQAPNPDSFQAHFEAVQAGGLRNLDFHRALTKIVLPVLLELATSLAAPYVIARGLLPLLSLPAPVLQYANLYAYQVYHGVVLLVLGSKRLRRLAVQLHNAIRDDKYLVGRQLNNFELQQQRLEAEQRAQKQQQQQQQQQEQIQEELGHVQQEQELATAAQ